MFDSSPQRLVDVDAIRLVARDLAALTPRRDRGQLQRVLTALLEPIRRLIVFERLVSATEECDDRARRQLTHYLTSVSANDSHGDVDAILERPIEEPFSDLTGEFTLIDDRELTALTSALASISLESGERAVTGAVDTVLSLVGGSRVIAAIVAAHRLGGPEVVVQQLRGGNVPGMPGELQDLIGGLNFGTGGRDLSDFDFDLPDFGVPHDDRDWLDDFFDPLDNPFDDVGWTDPDEWEPTPFWWKFPRLQEDIPPGLASLIACIMTVARLVKARAAIAPPTLGPNARYGMVWADHITSLDPTAHCPEDLLNIYGAGFAALRDTSVLVLPTASGCRAVSVPARNWTDTRIRVNLPTDVVSGPVGFADKAYVAAYNAWHEDQERRLEEIRGYRCSAFAAGATATTPFSVCAPNLGRNYLSAGAAIIDSFKADGRARVVVTPGSSVVLTWSARNCSAVDVTRVSTVGPAFPGSVTMVGSPVGSITLGPFGASGPQDATYSLRAVGPCGAAMATITVAVRKTPRLSVAGVELTQGIQAFGPLSAPNAASPLVANKDTIARVYVTHDLDSYLVDGTHAVNVSGRLRVNGVAVAPLNVAQALPSIGWINRGTTNDTLNFRIPAGLANGATVIGVTVWTTVEFEQPPDGELMRPSRTSTSSANWTTRRALRLRYVRVSAPGAPALSDAACRDIIVRAHDLLPAPPTDIAPARMPTWHTSYDPTTSDGKQTVLDHLDDQHDCTLSEAIFPWEDDCPPGDGAIWVGILPSTGGGLAQSHRVFAPGRNTLVAQADRIVVAHEIGHTQKLNHVNPGVSCGSGGPDGDYDSLPAGGMISPADAFDTNAGACLAVSGGPLYDMMTYACNRWISRSNWQRLFDKLS